jgi:hypothetical protein
MNWATLVLGFLLGALVVFAWWIGYEWWQRPDKNRGNGE